MSQRFLIRYEIRRQLSIYLSSHIISLNDHRENYFVFPDVISSMSQLHNLTTHILQGCSRNHRRRNQSNVRARYQKKLQQNKWFDFEHTKESDLPKEKTIDSSQKVSDLLELSRKESSVLLYFSLFNPFFCCQIFTILLLHLQTLNSCKLIVPLFIS